MMCQTLCHNLHLVQSSNLYTDQQQSKINSYIFISNVHQLFTPNSETKNKDKFLPINALSTLKLWMNPQIHFLLQLDSKFIYEFMDHYRCKLGCICSAYVYEQILRSIGTDFFSTWINAYCFSSPAQQADSNLGCIYSNQCCAFGVCGICGSEVEFQKLLPGHSPYKKNLPPG